MIKRTHEIIGVCLVTTILNACGGGGGGDVNISTSPQPIQISATNAELATQLTARTFVDTLRFGSQIAGVAGTIGSPTTPNNIPCSSGTGIITVTEDADNNAVISAGDSLNILLNTCSIGGIQTLNGTLNIAISRVTGNVFDSNNDWNVVLATLPDHLSIQEAGQRPVVLSGDMTIDLAFTSVTGVLTANFSGTTLEGQLADDDLTLSNFQLLMIENTAMAPDMAYSADFDFTLESSRRLDGIIMAQTQNPIEGDSPASDSIFVRIIDPVAGDFTVTGADQGSGISNLAALISSDSSIEILVDENGDGGAEPPSLFTTWADLIN